MLEIIFILWLYSGFIAWLIAMKVWWTGVSLTDILFLLLAMLLGPVALSRIVKNLIEDAKKRN